MKSIYVVDIRSLPNGQLVDEAILALAEQEIKMTRTGNPYVHLTLKDKTGSVSANVFDQGTLSTEYGVGDPLVISGVFSQDYNNINVGRVTKYVGQIDPEDFIPSSARDKDVMYAELMAVAESLTDVHLRNLVRGVFSDPDIAGKFKTWPAAKEVHHVCVGGLLEHTLAVVKLCEASAVLYAVNRDLLIAGAMLHDVGKLEELESGLLVTYTDVGRLYGHSLLGVNFVRDRIVTVSDFPDQLRDGLLHIIVSHLGKREWGAVVEPMTLEAFLMHAADNTDAKANRYRTLIEQQTQLEQNVGSRDFFLGTAIFAPRPQGES